MARIVRILIAVFVAMAGLSVVDCRAQGQEASACVITLGRIVDGDTLPHVRLPEVRTFARMRFKTKAQQRRYTRFIYNVKKALPYARLVAKEVNIIQDSLSHLPDAKAQEAYMKAKEKELFDKYEDQLKHLTITQGKILIKLIDRETGETSYELIRMLKGRFKAFWWQGIARIVGSNLKAEYDGEGQDRAIENIVLLIDLGYY